MKNLLYSFSVLILLTACSNPSSWVGASEDTVVERFGPPTKSYKTNNRTYMVYDLIGINYAVHPDTVTSKTNTSPSSGSCVGTFIVEDSTVEEFNVQGNACQIYQSQKE